MYNIIIQHAADKTLAPKTSLLRQWTKKTLTKLDLTHSPGTLSALNNKIESAEITIRIVDKHEMSNLNSTYRHKKGPTNVLSFPFSLPDDVNLDIPILGDIAICAEIVNQEAQEQGKSRDAHWAHMIVHGILHLLSYDHETESDAEIMESLEIEIMKSLGFDNPYNTGEELQHYD